LIELLVVIAIISMLAGQLLPALSGAKEKGRQANCINNLKQFDIAIELYYQDYESDYPCWLSNLYPSYIRTKKSFACLTDLYHGEKGHGHEPYYDAEDIPTGQNPIPAGYANRDAILADPGFLARNPEVTECSYLYEFNPNKCWWFHDSYADGSAEFEAADANGDAKVTWYEAKMWQSRDQKYEGKVPIARCFWHFNNYKQKVLNLSAQNHNVFTSGETWESTSY